MNAWVLIIILYTPGGAESNNVKYFNSSIECYAELKKEIYSGKTGYCTPVSNIQLRN